MRTNPSRRLATFLGGVALLASQLALKAETNATTTITVIGPGVTETVIFNPSDFYRVSGNDSATASAFLDPLGNVAETTASGTKSYQGILLTVIDNFSFTGLNAFSITFGPGDNDGFGAYYSQGVITNTSYASGTILEIKGLQGALTTPDYTPTIVYGSTDVGGDNAIVVNITNYNFATLVNNAPPSISFTTFGRNLILSWPTNTASECNLATAAALLETNTAWAVVTNTPVVANGQFQVNLPMTNAQEFFILESTN